MPPLASGTRAARDHAVWEEDRRTGRFIRPNEFQFHRKWDVRCKHQAIGLFLSWWICHLWSGVSRRGSIISASSYEHSSLSASESQLYWMTPERFCVYKHTQFALFTGFLDAHCILSWYSNQHTVRIIQWLSEGSERIYERCTYFVVHFDMHIYIYTVKLHFFFN